MIKLKFLKNMIQKQGDNPLEDAYIQWEWEKDKSESFFRYQGYYKKVLVCGRTKGKFFLKIMHQLFVKQCWAGIQNLVL